MAEASATIAEDQSVDLWLDNGIIRCTIWDGLESVGLTPMAVSALLTAIHACRRSLAHQLYAEGWSKRQIGIALNVGRRTIQLWLKEEDKS